MVKMNSERGFHNYKDVRENRWNDEMYYEMDINEVKSRLIQLYNDKVNELELIKADLEKASRQQQTDSENLAMERSKLKNLYTKKTQELESRYIELEKNLEIRFREDFNNRIQNHRRELSTALDVIKRNIDELENNISKMMQFQKQQSEEIVNQNDISKSKYQEECKVWQLEEFKELLKQQDKRVESLKNVVNGKKQPLGL